MSTGVRLLIAALGIGAGWGQAVATGRVRADVLNPFGAPLPKAEVRLVGRDRVFAAGEEFDLPLGTYRLEIRLPWYQAEREIRVVRGDNHVLFTVPFVTVTDVEKVTLELRFAGLPADCSLGYLQRLSDEEAVRVPIRVVGERTAVGPLELGFSGKRRNRSASG